MSTESRGIHETEAFVLRTYKLGEADKIVLLLTREAGLVRGVARGARRLKSRFGASLEPCTLVSVSFHEKEGRELVTLRRAEILRSYFDLSSDPSSHEILEYICDLMAQFAPPHQRDERLFRMLRACLEAAAGAPEDLSLIARYLEIWTLRLGGFLADANRCSHCKKALNLEAEYAKEGSLRCRECGSGTALSARAVRCLQELQRLAPTAWAQRARHEDQAVQRELAQFAKHALAYTLERAPKTYQQAANQ